MLYAVCVWELSFINGRVADTKTLLQIHACCLLERYNVATLIEGFESIVMPSLALQRID